MKKYEEIKPIAERLIGLMMEKNLAPEKISEITCENVAAATECTSEIAKIIYTVFSTVIESGDKWDNNLGDRLTAALKAAVDPPPAPKPVSTGLLGIAEIPPVEKKSKIDINDHVSKNSELSFESRVRALLIRECMKLGINCHPKTLESKIRKAGFAFEKRSRDNASIESWVRLEATRLDTRSQVIEILENRGYTVIQNNSDQTPTERSTVGNNDFVAILKSVENIDGENQETIIHQVLDLYGFIKIIKEDTKKNILS